MHSNTLLKVELLVFIIIAITTTGYNQSSNSYPIVHTGIKSFFNNNSEIERPATSDALFWQDAGRVSNSPWYTNNNNGIISDNITGLMWQQDMGNKLTYANAQTKADTLTLGGYTDWRIPTLKELYSLIAFTGRVKAAEAITLFIDTAYFYQPTGDESIGERSIDAQTWSSTHYTGLTMRGDTTIFGVNFVDGRIKGYPKYKPQTGAANTMYFRMVRGNSNYGKNSFTNNNNGTVTDSATMLMWQQTDDGVARDWQSSISYCEALELAGHTDWHLPNIKELQSIVDYTRSPQHSNSAAIDPVFGISTINDSEGNSGHYPYFWSTTTHQDGPSPYDAAAYIAFGEALGQMNYRLMDVHGAGAQRSDPKTGLQSDYPMYRGPQGDLVMVYNHCRCVRSIEEETSSSGSIDAPAIKLFPNPLGNILNIKHTLASTTNVNIKVFNSMSSLVLHHKTLQNQINIRDLAQGLYVVQITSDSEILTTQKIFKL